MSRAVIDTNIFLYTLQWHKRTYDFIDKSDTIYVSIITEMELLSYHMITQREMIEVKRLLTHMPVIQLSKEVQDIAVALRKAYRLKLADSIALASAHHYDIPFVTADKKLEKVKEVDVIIYKP